MAVMFSDGGPDIRWIGNEQGYARDPNWCTTKSNYFYAGIGGVNSELSTGHENGDQWLPAEVNTSIRPGWFYHKSQDDQVKSLNQLIDNWYHSVGMNGNFILNVPPDQRGLFHENDVARLKELRDYLDNAFSVNLAKGKKTTATNTRGNSSGFNSKKAIDSDLDTYWATDDSVHQAMFDIDLGSETEVNCVLLQEYIKLGQRVKKFSVQVLDNGEFKSAGSGITIGNRRLLKFKTVTTSKLRIHLYGRKTSLAISNIEVYRVPEMLGSPEISRNADGKIVISSDSPDPVYHFTTDGSEPGPDSPKFVGPYSFSQKGVVKAKAFVDNYSSESETVTTKFGISKAKWHIISGLGNSWPTNIKSAIDDNPNTYWISKQDAVIYPAKVKLDLGEEMNISGLTYLPRQDGKSDTNIFKINIAVSKNGTNWIEVVRNHEFGNIRNNPVLQKVSFKKELHARYLELTILNNAGSTKTINIAELGVITK
jgi:alpha-L-fucosidase